MQAIESLLPQREETGLEIVVVDNNSTDGTRQEMARYAAQYPSLVRYAFEQRTAFTKARSTGAEHAKGEILLYLDDDVLVLPGSLRRIVELFASRADAGIVAGKIMPRYTRQPPLWTLRCQDAFNAWSLYDPVGNGHGDSSVHEVITAAGPMMAVRRDVYDKVGGFPPDTIGVETNSDHHTFRKLYVGPGDWGLSVKIRQAGFKVYFNTDIACYHVIPPIRFTLPFWRSRMIGEGHYIAVADRVFFNLTPPQLYQKRCYEYLRYLHNRNALEAKLNHISTSLSSRLLSGDLRLHVSALLWLLLKRGPDYRPLCSWSGALRCKSSEITKYILGRQLGDMFPEELWVYFSKAYLETDYLLRKYPGLGRFLWQIASDGVGHGDFANVLAQLPDEYKATFVAESATYDALPLRSADSFERLHLHPEAEAEMKRLEDPLSEVAGLYDEIMTEPVGGESYGEAFSKPIIEALEDVVQRSIVSPEALLWLACVHHEDAHDDLALKYATMASEKDTSNPEVAQLLDYFHSPSRAPGG